MKKTIITAMAIVMVMMTSASATAPTRTLGSIVREAASAQITVHETKTADSWGLPMTHKSMKVFGIEDFFEATQYDFMSIDRARKGSFFLFPILISYIFFQIVRYKML